MSEIMVIVSPFLEFSQTMICSVFILFEKVQRQSHALSGFPGGPFVVHLILSVIEMVHYVWVQRSVSHLVEKRV